MLLGIDTSGAVSVAVARGTLTGPAPEILVVRGDDRSRHHDEVLLALVDEAMHEVGAQRSDLTGIVVGRGPGPFTGLRVGLVAARSIAGVLDVPLYGLSSLDALAHQAFATTDAAPVTVAVALDARRREVYHARYRRQADARVTREAEPAVGAPADVAAELTACDLLVGSGTTLYPELLPATTQLVHVDAGHLILAAAQLTAQGAELADTDPMYLRAPDAAKPTARKSTLGR
ncbi:tRNA (adenosine(37)-N6)-threonylcarbamoyltransferase complex dimerization subunit type 1 TsaB [Brachybacterium sp. FME24]|uniref:tRNA (adenosine(37)-N6)-threonylcarbamoyltransferase complex dimerization subunit type 1 TsaB n=1 Tax=Brachybacterium sp. FME24 TaxID=2742605 RepID=UPI001867D0F4|nr:tRNA (adenosine(37)-N6)-threonylcarbamoyltransferase complex dimerization subunit type 1 TsaB [Brachybacterium sp. FME24]